MATFFVDLWCRNMDFDIDPDSPEIRHVCDARYFGLYSETYKKECDDPVAIGLAFKRNNASCRVQVWHEDETSILGRTVDYDSRCMENPS
jgi:hypothetical protein